MTTIEDRLNKRASSVLVIGAGIAGITAAKELADRGLAVLVIEARDRIGGRIWTDKSLATPVDLGATWIHGKRNNPIAALSKKLGLKTMSTNYANSCLLDERGNKASLFQTMGFAQRADRIIPRLKRLAASLPEDICVEEAVSSLVNKACLSKAEMHFLNRHLIELEAYNGVSLAEQSLFALVDDSLKLDGGDLLFPQGYAQIVDVLAASLTINLGEVVLSVRQESDRVVVTTDKGAHVADAAIVTLPLGVLKAGRVTFSPPLPEGKVEAISAMTVGLFNKVAIRFNHVFWPIDCDMIELIPEKRTLCLQILNWYKYTGEPVLVICVAADTARAWEQESDRQIERRLLGMLQELFQPVKVGDVTGISITRWGKDEFALGAYLALHPGYYADQFSRLAEPFNRLFFAGEACIRANHGSVHGAHLSGLEAARRLHDFLRKNDFTA